MKSTVFALIGMSGSGKSYWSKRLAADLGFKHLSCDDLIAERLELMQHGSETKALAEWMGLPTDPNFVDREREYIELERAVVEEILAKIESSPAAQNTVVDTTGSFVYLGDLVAERLQRAAKVIYLELPEHFHEQLVARYLQEPKPIVWNGRFCARPGESPQETVIRCYRELIRYRSSLYERYAHARLDAAFVLDVEQTTGDFLCRMQEL